MYRRTFLKTGALAGAGILTTGLSFGQQDIKVNVGRRVGMIGLDTSHSIEFTKILNREDTSNDFGGYRVVAAYPHGSKDIESSMTRIPGYTDQMREMGIQIVDSIDELLKITDVILLETNDGRLHLEQAIRVFKAKKIMFIDKPVAGSLTDAISIFQAAKDFQVPVFSTSSMRYMTNMDEIVNRKSIGNILGASTYSPCTLEKTHPDFYWYGVHGVEALFTVMGTGCQRVSRIHTQDTDFAVGVWVDDRIGTFRGLRKGRTGFGGEVYGETGIKSIGVDAGYAPLLKVVTKYFQTGIPPVSPEETIEIFTFMEAADESKRRNGASVILEEVRQKALSQVRKSW
ncbi:MAG: Gfo/Idh/MocA family oxidoreductase [Tannerella sp.]|jgi:hypothetical protein|nr:Gfo/Idh/MocA family oxidoreductase [Tannerella sp.]